ncbi:MAG: alanine--glyoxylate aminotransferase family protein [Ardenticatenales bacterium]
MPTRPSDHIKLFIPGPVEVHPDILDAQARWMYGHRMPECAALFEAIEPKLQAVFQTERPVLISASSGTGLWEGASRNCVRSRVLHCVNGAFSERWAEVSAMNGKEVEVLAAEPGTAIKPAAVAEALAAGVFDALAVVHNETSAGVLNPIEDIARAVRSLPGGDDIVILVDAVSAVSGVDIRPDAWDLDVVLTSSQKAFALPPGLAFCSVSERAMKRAVTVPNRGYYFDFPTLLKALEKFQTPATPAISLLWALDLQLDRILAEGLFNRFDRHLAMRDRTLAWARDRDFSLRAEEGYASPTVSCIDNTYGWDIGHLNKFLRTRGMILGNGYGTLKNITWRIGHMGELTVPDIDTLLGALDDYLAANGDAGSGVSGASRASGGVSGGASTSSTAAGR